MRLGIIGAGPAGAGVARLAVAAGHRVTIADSRGPESPASLRATTGCDAGTAQASATDGQAHLADQAPRPDALMPDRTAAPIPTSFSAAPGRQPARTADTLQNPPKETP